MKQRAIHEQQVFFCVTSFTCETRHCVIHLLLIPCVFVYDHVFAMNVCECVSMSQRSATFSLDGYQQVSLITQVVST